MLKAELIHIDINHHGDVEDAVLQVRCAPLPPAPSTPVAPPSTSICAATLVDGGDWGLMIDDW